MNATDAQKRLRANGLSIRQFLAAKIPCSYSITRNGFRYDQRKIDGFIISRQDKNMPVKTLYGLQYN